MNWKDEKSLREQKAQLYTQAKNLRDAANNAKRDLTADESRDHDSIIAKLEDVNVRLLNTEAADDANKRNAIFGQSFESPHRVITSSDSVRALGQGESCADYLRASMGAERPGIGFGQMCRAMILGAKTAEEKRALAEGTDSAGGYTVPSVLFADVVDRLRPQAVCMKAGAQVVPLTSDKNSFAKVLTDPAATWRGENANVAIADPTFAQVLFQPKTLAVIVKVGRELLEDSININSALETIFAKSFASELDRAALVGYSGDGEPDGIDSMTDATEISMGTNGGALSSYAKILDGVQAVEDANASVNALVMAPRTARTINGFLDTTTQPLRRPDNLVNIPFHSTTAVPVNMTRGSGSALSSIYMGDFSRLWFGIRTELRVEVLREAFAGNLQYGFLAYLRADVQASHESAFAVVRGITA